MKRLYLACSIFLVTVPAFAHERARVEALEKKVQQLEEQLFRLTSATAPAVAKTGSEERANQQRVKAQERMQKDTNVYTQ